MTAGTTAILLIIGSYIVIRFPLFHVHELKQWPFEMALIGIIIAFVAMFRGNDFISILTADGYVVGFMLGLMLGGKEYLQMIWLFVMAAFVIVGIVITYHKRHQALKGKRK